MANNILRTQDYLTAISQILRGKRTQGEIDIAWMRSADIDDLIDLSSSLRILDLANGRLRPQYQVLQSEGHQVYGIDLINRPAWSFEYQGYRLARLIFSLYLPHGNRANAHMRLVCGDVSRLPFTSSYFDLVTSVAALEHFLDVPSVVSEVNRVLRPGGVAWISVHLFSCPSGAHNLRLMEIPLKNIPDGIDAWDHLRQRRVKITVPLNEWRIADYIECFASRFEILKHYCALREGEHLLTPEIEAELSGRGYTRDELTSGAYIIVARKPGS